MGKNIREFLTTGVGTQGTLLLERKIYDTLVEAVSKTMVGRQVAAIEIGAAGIPGSSVDLNLVTADSMTVFQVAEGGAIPMDVAAYTNLNLQPAKYAVRIAVTKEMQEDGKWDLIAHNVRLAGVELAENLDSLILTQLDGATNVVSGGANITVANITRAMQYLEDADFKATHFVVGPEVANDLRNIDTFVEFQKVGTREAFENGLIGEIFGMKVIRFSANIGTTTRAYVIDKDHALVIAEKRPVTVVNYDDATHDLSGAAVTQRIAVARLRDTSIARITTS